MTEPKTLKKTMQNRINAAVEFYFKGKKHAASVELDLEQQIQSHGTLPDLYPLLAKAINLDLYSYEYEMMQAEPLHFSQATGLCADYCHDGHFDIETFLLARKEKILTEKLEDIARKHLSVNNLQEHPELKKALLEAYESGKPK